MSDDTFWDLVSPVIEEADLPTWTAAQVLAWLMRDEEVAQVLVDVERSTPAHLTDYVEALGDYFSHVPWAEVELIQPTD